jgi:hypothetical protein
MARNELISHHEKFDFCDKTQRLIAAIHLITMNYKKDISLETYQYGK